jgi:hypothetical protein
MATGTLIAAVVIPIVLVALIGGAIFWFWRRRRNGRSRSRQSSVGMREKDNMLDSFNNRPRGDSEPEPAGINMLPPTTPNPAVRPLARINGQDRRHSNVPLTPRETGVTPRAARSTRSARSRNSRKSRNRGGNGTGGPFEPPPVGSAERIDDDAVSEISDDDAELEMDRLSAVSDLSYQDEEVGRRSSRRNR